MFNTLESNWDQSAHRGWTTLASFSMQAIGLGLLLAASLIWVERPPQVHWLQPVISRAGDPAATPQVVHGHHADLSVAKPRVEFTQPPWIADRIAQVNDLNQGADPAPSAPDLPNGFVSDRGPSGIPESLGNVMVAIPPRPVATKPLLVSHWAEGNLVYRVQPTYPALARESRVQGSVELRAVISKTGTIENLIVVSGHPMLSRAAIEAVRQWRYRPYLLNNEAVEVETEITVNFLLSGG